MVRCFGKHGGELDMIFSAVYAYAGTGGRVLKCVAKGENIALATACVSFDGSFGGEWLVEQTGNPHSLFPVCSTATHHQRSYQRRHLRHPKRYYRF